MREEEPELVKLFVRWFNIAFERKGKKVENLIEKIEDIMEVKDMLETSLRQYGQKMKNMGIQETAQKMIIENFPEDVIIRITGFNHEQLEKLREHTSED